MKTLIIGPAGVGKTSLMKTTCLGYSFVKVANLKPTKGISRENFIFRGLLELSVWDLGGQALYFDKYFSESQKPIVFGEIDVAIFMTEAVIDNSKNIQKIREIFDEFLLAVFDYSPTINKIYILINKVDLEDSKEDDVFNLLTEGLEPEIFKKCSFTPVSVKKGSAQHRLIEILDTTLQNSLIEMQKMNKVRSILQKIKEKSFLDIVLFNRPDGLIIASTFTGKFKTEPLKYMTLKIGSLESNIHSVFSKIMTLANKEVSPITLSMLIYESEKNYVFLKEASENTVLLLISPNKTDEFFSIAANIFSKQDILKELNTLIK